MNMAIKSKPDPEAYVTGSLIWLLRVARVAGLAPLNFVPKKDGWMIRPSFSWAAYGYLLVTTLCVSTLTFLGLDIFKHHEISAWTDHTARKVVWVFQVLQNVTTAAVGAYTALSQMRCLIDVLNQVEKIYISLGIHYPPKAWSTKIDVLMCAQILLCITVSCIEMVIRAFNTWQLSKDFSTMIYLFMVQCNPYFHFCYWVLQLRNLQYIATVLHVKHAFTVVNQDLTNLIKLLETEDLNISPLMDNFVSSKNEKTNLRASGGKLKHRGVVRQLAVAYAQLCSLVRHIDSFNGVIVLLMMTGFFLHLISTPYHMLITFVENNLSTGNNTPRVHWSISLILGFWCFFHTFNLVMTVEPCDKTHLEMEATRDLVGNLISSTHSSIYNTVSSELDQFFNYLVLNELHYRPLKLMTMSRSLVMAIFGSITTYIVIIFHL